MPIAIPRPEERPQVEERLRKMVQRWPQVSGYHLNPEPAVVEGIVQGLVRSVMAHGYPYCPCRDLTGDPAKDRVNICPCQFHRDEIARDGHCRCVLYVGDNYDPRTAYAYQPPQEGSLASAVRSIRQREVTIYLTSWCYHSRRIRSLLEQKRILYTAVDIEQNPAAAKLVEEWNHGQRSVPTLVVRTIATEPSIAELEHLLLASDVVIAACTAYITNWCGQSRRVKAWLADQSIAAKIVDIEADPQAMRQVEAWNNGMRSVPTLDITVRMTEPTSETVLRALGL